MATTDGFTFGTLDLGTVCDIADFSGVLLDGSSRGDLIVLANQPGAVWEPGPKGTYTFDIPVIFLTDDEDTAIGHLQTVQALEGVQDTMVRTVAGDDWEAEGVLIQVVVFWDLNARNLVEATLIFQNLDGTWTPVAGS